MPVGGSLAKIRMTYPSAGRFWSQPIIGLGIAFRTNIKALLVQEVARTISKFEAISIRTSQPLAAFGMPANWMPQQ